ncbi:hypothetical protein SNOG_00651 [Parastagonospora nodorum SN15]|uniref:Uncharacterized protein n=1 Tax=Phaeosphaeria nodorum (strain SN15 / ATCC MYA-4574 / FGSC 10173) TaxID=321614 RepID=Q0V5R3_PHANO|nr:hypothetical protein SNOG_00651 [Parastagonospora nodorum SN15]EAT92146.1 hypothetical protein SNOG_00651 [Parastagonospora nodorum SN15]
MASQPPFVQQGHVWFSDPGQSPGDLDAHGKGKE